MSQALPIGTVHSRTVGSIAVLTIDFPPLNLGSRDMRQALLEAIAGLSPKSLTGVVLTGEGATFVAGSDFREFDVPPQEPHLPQIIAAIEDLPFPVVAAIGGAALGGGCELALGCDWRVAASDAVLGLPEATLGLIPGAGGTVRLPRLVGSETAIEMVSSGRRVDAQEAKAMGLVDAIAEGDLVEAAIGWLDGHKHKRRATNIPMSPLINEEAETLLRKVERRARGAVAPVAAAHAVIEGMHLPPDEALQRERAESLRLRVAPQSKALRYLFQAERRAGRVPKGAQILPIHTIGVVGAGRMGTDIALVFASTGHTVRLVEAQDAIIARAQQRIATEADRLVGRGTLTHPSTLIDRIGFVAIQALSDCQLVVEAVPEQMGLKRELLAQLEAIVPDTTILATNTSYLDINEMGQGLTHPQRLVGLHFFNPATALKLVEVVRAEKSGNDVVASVLALARNAGKLPIVTAVGEGFVGNRIFAAYRRHCEILLEDGCLPAQIDRAMRAFGMAMGPFEVFDLAGLDVAWSMRKRLAPTRDPRERYVEIPDRLCEAGRLGRNAGKGWYDYVEGEPMPSPEVEKIIQAASAARGREPQCFQDSEIVERLLTAMASEAVGLVAEGIASRPAEVDVALCNGFGFPRHAGGALYWASTLPLESLVRKFEEVAQISGRPGIEGSQVVVSVLAKLNQSG